MKKISHGFFAKVLSIVLCLALIPISAVATEPAPTSVSNLSELKTAISGGVAEIEISSDITLDETLVLTAPVTIKGTEKNKASLYSISGNDTFCLIAAGGNALTLENLKLEHGNAAAGGYSEEGGFSGGAISSQGGDIVATNCIFANNQASANGGAIYGWAAMTFANCDFSSNTAAHTGGAVYTAGAITATDSTFTSNSAAWFGGALYSISGDITATNSTFTGNTATAAGSTGGAINAFSGSVTATNTVFTSNTALENGGAINAPTGAVTLIDCTVTGSSAGTGGAIYAPANVNTFTRVRFEGNTATWGPCAFISAGGSITGTVISTGNTDNGGAGDFANGGGTNEVLVAVMTAAELSKAVSDGAYAILVGADITLTETLYLSVPTTIIGFDNKNLNKLSGNGTFCLIAAGYNALTLENLKLENGNAAVGGYSEEGGFSGGAICAFAADIIATNCAFENNQASANGGAIYCWNAVTLTNCKFTSNTAAHTGGCVYTAGAITATDSTFTSNSAAWFGGAFYSISGAVTATNCTFTSNRATAEGSGGGAIHAGSGSVTATDTVFTGNTALGTGGAINAPAGAVTLTSCEFTGSSAGTGGAIYAPVNVNTLNNVRFEGNTAQWGPSAFITTGGSLTGITFSINNTDNGGAGDFANGGGTVDLSYAIFTDKDLRTGAAAGWDIMAISDNIELTGTVYLTKPLTLVGLNEDTPYALIGNDTFCLINAGGNALTISNLELAHGNAASGGWLEGADYSGGAICAQAADISATNCHFTNNQASANGGAIYCWNAVTLTSCSFTSNTTGWSGGAVYTAGAITTSESVFTSNAAGQYAGALYSIGGAITSTNSVFTTNTTGWFGGAIYAVGGNVSVTGSTFTGNTATASGSGGGALVAEQGTVTATGSTFTSNTALGNGGAIYAIAGNTVATDCTFSNNSAAEGTCIYNGSTTATTTVTGSKFSGNTGAGLVFSANSGTLTLGVNKIEDSQSVISDAIGVIFGVDLGNSTNKSAIKLVATNAVSKKAKELIGVAKTDSRYEFSLNNIVPQDINDSYKLELVDDAGNVFDTIEGYNIVDYLNTVFSTTTSEKTKSLIANMLQYTIEVQKYGDIALERRFDLPTGMDTYLTNEAPADGVRTITVHNQTSTSKLVNATLLLANRIKVRFTAVITDSNAKLVVTYTDDGTPKERTFKPSDAIVVSGDKYTFELDGLAPYNYGMVYEVVLKDGGNNALATVTYNAKAYFTRMQENEECGDLVKALYQYGLAAEAYKAD